MLDAGDLIQAQWAPLAAHDAPTMRRGRHVGTRGSERSRDGKLDGRAEHRESARLTGPEHAGDGNIPPWLEPPRLPPKGLLPAWSPEPSPAPWLTPSVSRSGERPSGRRRQQLARG